MDEMKIVSKFVRGMIAKIVKTVLSKKFGYNVDIYLNEMTATFNEGKAHVHLNIDADLDRNELIKILKNFGID